MRFFNLSFLLLFILFIFIKANVLTGDLANENKLSSSFNSHKLARRHGDHGHSHEGDEHDHEHGEEISTCGDVEAISDYDQNLHIGVLFLMVATSFIGCSFTALSNKIPFLKLPNVLIDVGRHFGTGVILSTAFIHMLMSSVFNLTHKCAPKFFQNYTSSAPLIAMIAALALHLIEFLVLDYIGSRIAKNPDVQEAFHVEDGKHSQDSGCTHSHADILLLTERKVSTYILELGILSHSIFIGLSLGVTSGPHFIPLVIAVVFHQFFEGIGLGARIARLEFHSIIKPLIMVLSFSVTTSIGIGIGIAVHTAYSSSSPTALAVQGIFDAISAGILIYTGLVELLAREISTKSEFIQHPWGVRVLYFFALYLGVAAMAIIGIWA